MSKSVLAKRLKHKVLKEGLTVVMSRAEKKTLEILNL